MINIELKQKKPKFNSDKILKKVYCLYRVSNKNQVDCDDIPMQKQACHEFIASHYGWYLGKEFYEKGVSGYSIKLDDRDGLQKIKEAAENHEFDVFLVFMFDRIGRREDETPFVLEFLSKQGIEVWSVKEGQQRFDSHEDELINYIRF